MRRIRVLVVDDAVVVRRIVTDVLAEDAGLEVAGTAANGRIALQKIPQVNPDLITLDVEMPEMDGLATVREIRKRYPKLPVIMFSTLTERGASATLDAIAGGANDYVTKPANVGSVPEAMARIRTELIPKIRALCPLIAPRPASPTPVARPTTASAPVARPAAAAAAGHRRVECVVIGVSTGGPNALGVVLPALPKDLPVPVLLVQHMPPVFTRLLAERLASRCKVAVAEAAAGMKIEPGKVLIAPGDHHLVIDRSAAGAVRAQLNREPPENSCRPAVDVLFRSAAHAYGGGVLAVVLTGMGYDGHLGSQCVKDAGGQVLAQDEATSVVWGMPGAVAQHAGLADRVLPLDQVAAEIVRRVQIGRVARIGAVSSAAA